MNLSHKTEHVLRNVRSIHKPDGFQSHAEIQTFWTTRCGATSFLNIQEITPQMVREIRLNIISTKRASVL